MAEVLDIIHNLQYKADVSGLEKAYASIQNETKAIDKEAESVQRLEALRAKTDASNVTRINQINAAIDNRKRKIEGLTATITKEIQVNETLRNSLARQGLALAASGDMLDKTSRSTNSAAIALSNLGRVAQDAPFGFLGIANNLNPLLESFQRLQVEAKATGASVGSLLTGALTGPAGLGIALSVVSALLVVFGDDLLGAAKDAETTQKEIDGITQSLNKLIDVQLKYNRSVESVVGEGEGAIRRDISALKARGATAQEVFDAEQKLRRKEAANLKEEEQLFNRVQEIYQQNKDNIDEILTKPPGTVPTAILGPLRDAVKKANEEGVDLGQVIVSRQQEVEEKILDKNSEISDAQQEFYKGEREKAKSEGEKAAREMEKSLKKAQEAADKYRELLRTFRADTAPNDQDVEAFSKELADAAKASEAILKQLGDSFGSMLSKELAGNSTDPDLRGDLIRQQAQKETDDLEKKRQKTAQAAQQKQNKEIVESYITLRDTIVGIIDSIYDRQIQLLDLELDRRRQNIGYAVELAERGNVQLLNSERDRITELEKDRERAAARQIQLNSLIAASNSALAVTQAIRGVLTAATTTAEEGGGIIGFIASLIAGAAAVAGLYTALRAANDANSGFKDGEVDIQGPGTTTSDSIRTRISKGESVINAASTARYKPLLQAINDGTFDATKLHAHTAVMAQPQKQVAYLSDKQMAELMEAFQGGQVNVKQTLDSAGFSQQVETYSRRERARFNHG